MTPEDLARQFHETYERLAPDYGYATRRESAVPWAAVPEKNKRLMIAVCCEILTHLDSMSMPPYEDAPPEENFWDDRTMTEETP